MPRLRRRDRERVAVAVMAAAGKIAEDAFDALDLIAGYRSGFGQPVGPAPLANLGLRIEDDDDDGPTNHSLLWLWPAIVDITRILPRASPRWWVMRRSAGLWKDLPDDDAEDDHYLSLLRMRHSTFDRLLWKVGPLLEREIPRFRLPLPPAKKLAYALHRWAHGDHHGHSCSGYGLGRTRGLPAVMDVAEAIVESYPGAVGFGGFAEHARMQKFPGTVGDARVLKNTSLYRRVLKGHLFLDDVHDPFLEQRDAIPDVPGGYLLGDGGYPSLLWLVIPYGRQQVVTHSMDVFDSLHKIVRSAVEQFFGVFKMRFLDYVCDRHALDEEMESAERELEHMHRVLVARGDTISVRMRNGRAVCETEVTELEHMHRVLVARGDTISVRMRNGRAVCETEVTQDSRNALRWAAIVADRVRSSRSGLQQCCDNVVTRHVQLRRELQRWRRMWEDSRMAHDGAARGLREAERELADIRRRCEVAESEVVVARRQAEDAWRLVDEIMRSESAVGKSDGDDFCEVFEGLSVKEKGKSVDTSHHKGASSPSSPMCHSCENMSSRLAHIEHEIVKLQATNEMLQWPASVWEEWDNDLKMCCVPRKFPPPPGSSSSTTKFGDSLRE
ncbi:hypothetical protein CBR_g37050 [Chara braunii]|uniref:DDE Tnp4 domain-containing protein n=1 Tax=Chara braunii TaxID=69332 RepID=A0A388LM09_CHABU|nr:hypothetical protein CBR_g37050 [Chara braunii]|eukprot:GBG83337.1 hypothetical protein CBR_g37050 [Chara braunii]